MLVVFIFSLLHFGCCFYGPVISHSFKAVPSVVYYSSDHPYDNNVFLVQEFSIPSAMALIISFSADTEVELNYDFVSLCGDVNCIEVWDTYSGILFPGVGNLPNLTIPVNAFYLKFTSDHGVVAYGFDIIVTEIVPTEMPTSQPSVPSGQPTSEPSVPSGQPSSEPSVPSSQPSSEPTSFDVQLLVISTGDATSDLNSCKRAAETCNLRSAVDICVSVATPYRQCSILLPVTGSIVLDPVYGELVINSTTNIIIDGRGSAVLSSSLSDSAMRFLRIVDSIGVLLTNISIVAFNSLNSHGGAVHISNVTNLELNNVSFIDNAGGFGGAIYMDHTTGVIMSHCTLTGNNAEMGGGIYFDSDNNNVTIISSQVADNVASIDGGGLYFGNYNNYFVITSSLVIGNVANAGNGGGLFVLLYNNDFTITASVIDGNDADTLDGGGIYLKYGNERFTIDSSAVIYNSAWLHGGAIFLLEDNLNFFIRSSTVDNNNAAVGNAAAIYLGMYNHDFTIISCTIDNNYAFFNGGAIFLDFENYDFTIISSSVSRNSALLDGGGLYLRFVNDGLTIVDSDIHGNKAFNGAGLYLNKFNYFLNIISSSIKNNKANINGGGILLHQNNEECLITQSSIKSNEANFLGGGVHAYRGNNLLRLSSSSVISNSASLDGGGIYLHSHNDKFTVTTTLVESNSASISGGGIYVLEKNEKFSISDLSSVSSNTAGTDGGGIYIHKKNNDFSIMLTSVSSNTGDGRGGGIYIHEKNDGFTITSSTIDRNTASFNGGGIYLHKGNDGFVVNSSVVELNTALFDGGGVYLYVQNDFCSIVSSVVRTNEALNGGGTYLFGKNLNFTVILSFVDSNYASTAGAGMYLGGFNDHFSMYSSNLSYNVADIGGGVYLLECNNNFALRSSCVVSNYANIDGGGIYLRSYNDGFRISSSLVENNTASANGGGIYLYALNNHFSVSASLVVSNAAFFNGGGLLTMNDNIVSIAASKFEGNWAFNGGGAIFGASCHVDIADSFFNFNDAPFGGVAMTHDTSLEVNASTFMSNFASEAGGAMFMTSCPSGNISLSTFVNNVAVGSGSAIWISQSNYPVITNNSFVNNSAGGGGSVYWQVSETIFDEPYDLTTNNIYSGNVADYGNDYATNGIGIRLQGEYEGQVLVIDSNNTFPNIIIEVYDYYGQLYILENDVVVTATAISIDKCMSNIASISGQIKEEVLSGIATFSSLDASCIPTGSFDVEFSTIIDSLFVSTLVLVTLDACQDGYVSLNHKCIICGNGFYSLNFSVNSQCVQAPVNADQYKTFANNIFVEPGYWRINGLSTSIMKCPHGAAACVGGYSTGDASCTAGYEGPMCGVCSHGYYSSTTGSNTECLLCDDAPSIIIMLPGLIVGFLIVVGVCVTIFICGIETHRIREAMAFAGVEIDDGYDEEDEGGKSDCGEENNNNSVVTYFDSVMNKVKILISSYQIVTSFPFSLNVEFPVEVSKLFDVMMFVNFLSIDISSGECYVDEKIDYVSSLVISTLIPLAITVLLLLSFAGNSLLYHFYTHEGITAEEKRKRHQNLVSQYFTLFLLLTYFVLPGVSSTIAQAYSCINIDVDNVAEGDDLYLRILCGIGSVDRSISCSSSRYRFGVLWATAMLFVYPIGIPGMYLFFLHKHRSDISSRQDKNHVVENSNYKTLDFLFQSYEPKFWYWEVIEAVRRLFFTFLLEFGAASEPIQMVGSIVMAIVFMKIYGYFEPYEDELDDILQEMSQYQVFFTLLGALLLYTGVLGTSSNVLLAISISLIIVNTVSSFTCLVFFVEPFVQGAKGEKEECIDNGDKEGNNAGSNETSFADIYQTTNSVVKCDNDITEYPSLKLNCVNCEGHRSGSTGNSDKISNEGNNENAMVVAALRAERAELRAENKRLSIMVKHMGLQKKKEIRLGKLHAVQALRPTETSRNNGGNVDEKAGVATIASLWLRAKNVEVGQKQI